jgi:AraC-like DNA-binding protein
LIGEENRDVLLNAIGLKTLSNTASHPINPQIRKTLLDVVNPNLQGSMKLLYAEAKVLEFICSLQEFVSKYTESNISSKQNLKKVYELHEYLCNLDGELPKLEILAKNFNMSLRNLNRVFSKEFGLPIYSFITKHRLQEAHLAIENSEVTQKQLASKLGYSHVNNFRAAFKKEFNYSPGSLRK